ncbi:MAG TPA: aldehyde dehydrogenase family protein [Armatimonadaceae bacterium]|nr:aldehyde dehydrogenase family protein [Armatimonadaceae bacterium]
MSPESQAEWPSYVAGARKRGSRGVRTIASPFDGTPVGSVSVSDADDARDALRAAHESFAATRRLSSDARHRILRAVHDGIAARREEFARGITAEAGKPIRDARAEVDRALLVFSLAADEARRIGGEILPLDLNAASAGRQGFVRRFPVGPVAAVTPFNFPLNLVAHKVAPAIAAGCPVVLKPAESTPITALRLAEVVDETEWPKGAFSVLTPEQPEETVDAMLADDRLPVFSFTGSARVGWALKARAAKKRVTLELGGNAGVIVHEDAPLEYAVQRCVTGAFANAGQVCISVQRVFVHRPVWERFRDPFVAAAARLRVGDPSDEATDVGPMIRPSAREKTLEVLAEAERAGAQFLLRGEPTGESLLGPTVLTGVAPDLAVCREEVFAPVVVLEPYDDFEEALARVDDSPYGLQAGVFTRDVGRLFRAWERLEVGGVIANDVPQYRVDNMPYGGEKGSGFGREGVRYAIEEMTQVRLLVLNLPHDR